MKDSPFTAIGDEPVEARIVAWVLGEASAFEAAELERLCEERPELLVFRRRMRAIHGLLTEAEAAQPDDGWKLPEEKRKALDEIFGDGNVACPDVEKEKRIRRSGRRAILAIAACLVLTVIVAGLVGGGGNIQKARKMASQREIPTIVTYDASATEADEAEAPLPQLHSNRGMIEDRREGKLSAATKPIEETVAHHGSMPKSPTEGVRVGGHVRAPGQVDFRNEMTLEEAVQSAGGPTEFGSTRRVKIFRDGDAKSYDLSKAESRKLKLQPGDVVEMPQKNWLGDGGEVGSVPGRPSAPSASAASVVAANSNAPAEVPVPESAVPAPSIDYGDRDDFGDGWSDGTERDERMPVLGGQFADNKKPLRRDRGVVTEEVRYKIADAEKVPSPSEKSEADAATKAKPSPGYSGLAQREMIRRSKAASEGDRLLAEGREANARDDKQLNEAAVAQAMQNRKVGKYDEARKLLGNVLDANPNHTEAKRELSYLDDPIRTSPALTYEHTQNVEKVRRNLYKAEGNFNLGKFDAAKTEYENALRVDANNAAARRGLEKIETAKTQYYRAAYDHTRAELLSQVDDSWELSVPADPESNRDRVTLEEADEFDFAGRFGAMRESGPVFSDLLPSPAGGFKQDLSYLNTAEPPASQTAFEGFANFGRAIAEAPVDAPVFSSGELDLYGDVSTSTFQGGAPSEYFFKGSDLASGNGDRQAAIKPASSADLSVAREFQYPTEYELPELADAAAAPNDWMSQDEGVKADLSDPLQKAIKDQENKVEERRKVLATIARTKGIVYKGTDSFYGSSGVNEDQGATNALQTFHQIEKEKMQLESQISSLLKYDSDQLMVYASGLDLPDNVVRNLYPQYQEAKRLLEAEKIKGLGDGHPTVISKTDQVESMKRQLDEGIVNLRATLKAQLDLATDRLKSVDVMKDETREEAIKRGLDAQDYVDAKKEFEVEQERLQQMKRKLAAASAKAKPSPSKPDLAKLMEEIAAAEDPYSTFSLNISDASFQIALAALDKGEQPDPAGIKVEQFYNAVDYGDPAPAAGQPVAVSIEQAAHPVIPGRNLVRVAVKTAAAGRSAAQPLRLTLLVDQSGSMVREDRRAAMDKALGGLAELLTENDLVTVIGFSRTPRLLADGMTGDQAAKLKDLVNQSASEGGTNLEAAMQLAEQMADRRKLDGAQNRIVLFTDGAANLGNADPEKLAERVKQLRLKGIAFDIAGIAAEDLNDDLLGELARNGNGRYYVVGKGADDNFAKQLAGAFRPAAENVKVQVRFNPERVGRYKLIGFEKDRLKTEDFRNDAVDAAELAAEEAGVAIYQVEVLPEGSGEIGEVGVRFRDTGANEMVERSWTIPHDRATPAIDRATPSMQLAVMAMLAAEKLKGGPMADAIDFNQLAEPAANIKRFFGDAGRMGEVLRMVNLLK